MPKPSSTTPRRSTSRRSGGRVASGGRVGHGGALLLLGAALSVAATARASSLVAIGSEALGVSADGRVVVGRDGTAPFRWDNGVLAPLPMTPEATEGEAFGVSSDGAVAVGRIDGQAVRWQGPVLEELGVAGVAHDASADGSVVVGGPEDAFVAAPPPAFRWQGGVPSLLPTLPGCDFEVGAFGVSENGTNAVGWCRPTSVGQASRALLWSGSFVSPLPHLDPLDPSAWSAAVGISPSGRVVGTSGSPSGCILGAPVAWTGLAVVELAVAAPLTNCPGRAVDASAAKGPLASSTVVGGSNDGGLGTAVVWQPGDPGRSLWSILQSRGVSLAGWDSLDWAYGVSHDGSVVVGKGVQGGADVGFRAEIPQVIELEDSLEVPVQMCAFLPCDLLFIDPTGGLLVTDVTVATAPDPHNPPDPVLLANLGIDADTIDFASAGAETPVWQIEFDGSFSGLEITFHYDDATLFDGVPESGLAVFHWKAGIAAWEELPVLARDPDADTLAVETGSLSPFVLGVQRTPCNDGLDDDGDGKVDWPEDEGCRDLAWHREDPKCSNGVDDDGDGKIDWDGGGAGVEPDPQCLDAPYKDREGTRCGLGAETVLLLAASLAAARRRRAVRPR